MKCNLQSSFYVWPPGISPVAHTGFSSIEISFHGVWIEGKLEALRGFHSFPAELQRNGK